MFDAQAIEALDRRLAALYFYGYATEILVKAAYLRFVQAASSLPPTTPIDHTARIAAVGAWNLLGLAAKPGPHDISGWAQLLDDGGEDATICRTRDYRR